MRIRDLIRQRRDITRAIFWCLDAGTLIMRQPIIAARSVRLVAAVVGFSASRANSLTIWVGTGRIRALTMPALIVSSNNRQANPVLLRLLEPIRFHNPLPALTKVILSQMLSRQRPQTKRFM